MKISEHALHLLIAISGRCENGGFWLPPTGNKTNLINPNKYDRDGNLPGGLITVFVDGGGTASALRKLERDGLIVRPKTTLPDKYAYAITEDGLLAIEKYRSGEE